jgi:hypothetical protein
MQHKEIERWHRVDLMMAFLQDLRQAISDRYKLDRDTRHVLQAWRKGSTPALDNSFWLTFPVFYVFS